jgi:hypothetical protein
MLQPALSDLYVVINKRGYLARHLLGPLVSAQGFVFRLEPLDLAAQPPDLGAERRDVGPDYKADSFQHDAQVFKLRRRFPAYVWRIRYLVATYRYFPQVAFFPHDITSLAYVFMLPNNGRGEAS